ncbi:hypothetical protein BTW07_06095 [Salinicola socius]|uniref:Uncharacterized protein n=1 Tax=Salinicola socius TaxID=404433 RepID=A0A1Q8SUQ9_9GAMM|nr:hypothetical protein BTW07_06095 [Salinicola socius]
MKTDRAGVPVYAVSMSILTGLAHQPIFNAVWASAGSFQTVPSASIDARRAIRIAGVIARREALFIRLHKRTPPC